MRGRAAIYRKLERFGLDRRRCLRQTNTTTPRRSQARPINNLNGTSTAPMTITGAEVGQKSVSPERSTHNTIRFSNASCVIVRNPGIDCHDLGGDGVTALGASHHITPENLTIRGVGGAQKIVDISTNASPDSNWTIRGNTIIGAGTRMYLGNSSGTNPFAADLIERKVIGDAIGHNWRIKHQVHLPSIPEMLSTKSTMIVRPNVFAKAEQQLDGRARAANLFVGDVPPGGPGQPTDRRSVGTSSTRILRKLCFT